MKRKPRLNLFRKIVFWVLYDPIRKEVIQIQRYKYELAVPSRESGRVMIQCKGFYPTPLGKPAESP